MMCLEASASSGRSCSACRSEACGKREGLIVLQVGAVFALIVLFVGGRRRGRVLRIDMGGILELRARRQSVDFDHAGIAHIGLHPESVAHRAGDDLQLLLVLVGERDQDDEEAHQEPHQIGEGHEPAVTAGMRLFTLGHALRPGMVADWNRPPRVQVAAALSIVGGAERAGKPVSTLPDHALGRHRLRLFRAVFFRQVGDQHFTDQRRALGVADHEDAVDDRCD